MSRQKKKKKGFTLIELLVVIGILAILLTITLIAINPAEQLNESSDVSDKTVTDDIAKATVEYLTTDNTTPWQKNSACNVELATGGTLASMPDCVHELVQGGKLENSELQSQQLQDIHMSKCGSTAVLCFNPRSKQENESAEAHYDKFGNNQPGCPLGNGTSPSCYICRPVLATPDCDINAVPTSTPTPIPTDTPIPTATPTPTPLPTATPMPTSTPTPTPIPTATPVPPTPTPSYNVGPYALDDTKLFQTYAVFFFNQPSFASSWYFVSVSTDPTFPNDSSKTDLYFAPSSTPQFGSAGSASNNSYLKFSNKLVAYQSLPNNWSFYKCGVTLYWKIRDFPTFTQYTQTYSNVIDCSTKVGAFSTTGAAPLNWYIYYPYINADNTVRSGQPYNSIMDANGDGFINWVDYIILSMNTKMRAGGWAPPE